MKLKVNDREFAIDADPEMPVLWAPAFANAVTQLTGKPLRRMPFKIENRS
jgi:hypothetical protein